MDEYLQRIIDKAISQGRTEGDARRLVLCVENLMKADDITVSEACEKLGCTLEEYEDARNMQLEDA